MIADDDKNSIRVLYVDDDAALARLVQKTLGRAGFVVEHVYNANEALDAIARKCTDVIALDHYLPNGTGLEFLAHLASEPQVPPVVYVTGSSELNLGVSAMRAGASDFVAKTIGEDFVTILGSALEQAVAKARLVAQKEAAEAEVRLARDRAELLLAEVNHRVANSLSLVSALVSLQASHISDNAAKEALSETKSRILAIASVHKRLNSINDVRRVDLAGYLNGLLESLQESLQAQGHGAWLRTEISPLSLRTDDTVNLGIVVTELVTNALKYAYPGRSGEIRVRLNQIGERCAELVVEDDGVGRGEAAKGTGLGTRIINAMATSMAAEMEYLSLEPGTSARLVFKLDQQ